MKEKWIVRTEFPKGYGAEKAFNSSSAAYAFAREQNKKPNLFATVRKESSQSQTMR